MSSYKIMGKQGQGVSGQNGMLRTDYLFQDPTGYDDTNLLQEFMDDMSSDAVAQGTPRTITLGCQKEYQVRGIVHREFVDLDGNYSRLKKINNYSQSLFTGGDLAVIRAVWTKKNDSWYGSNRKMSLRNITLDGNNKQHLALADYLNVEEFFMDNVTMIASPWCLTWTTRIGGKNILIRNPRILGNTRVFQDGMHIMFGDTIHIEGGYIESGDDGIAFGDDQVTNLVYYNDQGLTNFSANGVALLSTRGNGIKVYRAATAPFSGAPNNYVKNAKVSGGRIHAIGKVGLLRNGGVQVANHASANNRVPSDIRDVHIHCDFEVGTNGRSIYSAIAGELVGSPTSVTKANPAVVTLAGHGLTAGKVVAFVDIPSTGMTNLVGFYAVRANPTADTFQLAEDAYRPGTSMNSTSYANWTTGNLLVCSTGSGYVVGDIVSPAGGDFMEQATFRVVQVGPNGEIEAVLPVSRGDYNTLPASPANIVGGSGTGGKLFLETVHQGVNAYGASTYGCMDVQIDGSLRINDTTGSATRFEGGRIVDSQRVKFKCNIPSLPALGGVWVLNEASTLKSMDNEVDAHFTGNVNVQTSAGYVMTHNSARTRISGLFDEIPTNVPAVRAIIGGNSIESKNITAISSADPSVFTVVGHGRKVGDPVIIAGNTLSAGSINNIGYRVRSAPSVDTVTLETMEGQPVTIGAATMTVGGTMALAPNSMTIENLTVQKRAGATGTSAVNNSSDTPHRAMSVTVRNSDFTNVDIKIASSVATAPQLTIQNVAGLNEGVREYRAASVTHDALSSDSIIVNATVPVTINAPTNARKGQRLRVTIVQGATAQAITWNAIFKKAADGALVNNGTGVIDFFYNGSAWVQQGAALAYYA